MGKKEPTMHFVCTLDEAKKLIEKHKRFWVSNCGCREGKGECARSRLDVCLMFRDDIEPSGSGMKKITKGGVQKILREATSKKLVPRPFRDTGTFSRVDGVCFCCDDCCSYFADRSSRCDKGKLVERTDRESCTACGTCVEACYFDAREVEDGTLVVDRKECYGCGLCVDECPNECVKMVNR